MTEPQSQKTLANVCLFCGETLTSPSMCTFCGFKFCEEHKSTDSHQCIKTRYSEYIRKSDSNPPANVSTGKFKIVCEMCGFSTSKPVPIEYAGEELIQHTQIVGCSDKVFLEEVKESGVKVSKNVHGDSEENEKREPEQIPINSELKLDSNSSEQGSIVDQIIQLSALKDQGKISEEEFSYIKKELIKKLQ